MLVWEEDMVKALRKERDSLREENARLAALVQQYHPAYLGLPHVVRERNEARAEVEKERAYADASNQDAIAAEAEVARLSDKCAADAASAAAEILRLEGLILDWDSKPKNPLEVYAAKNALIAECERIRAQREEEQHRKHPTGDYCVWCHSQWPCEEGR